MDIGNFLASFNCEGGCTAKHMADTILMRAMELDQGRPNDDMSVVVLSALPREENEPKIRRLHVSIPLERLYK